MKVLVTGSNGFIGSNLVKALLAKKVQVRAYLQPGTSPAPLDGLDVEKAYGDITSAPNLMQLMEDVTVVYHLAAKVADWGKRHEFYNVNVEGTKNLAKAAAEVGVKRFVFLSSVAIHSPTGHLHATEKTIPDNLNNPYAVSKIQAEALLQKMSEEAYLNYTIIRPGLFPFGQNDYTSFFHLAQALEKGRFAYVSGGQSRLSTAYVENLVEGIVQASVAKIATRQTYVIADDVCITWKDLIEKICRHLKTKPPKMSVPRRVARMVAGMSEATAWATGRKTPPKITRYRVDIASTDYHFQSAKAKKELGYEPKISLDEGLKRTAAWYRQAKHETKQKLGI